LESTDRRVSAVITTLCILLCHRTYLLTEHSPVMLTHMMFTHQLTAILTFNLLQHLCPVRVVVLPAILPRIFQHLLALYGCLFVFALLGHWFFERHLSFLSVCIVAFFDVHSYFVCTHTHHTHHIRFFPDSALVSCSIARCLPLSSSHTVSLSARVLND